MARPKKGDDKARAGATLEIDVDSFVRTRDSVVTGLATLQDAIQTLSTAYINHTNAVLGEHGAGLDVGSALSKLGHNLSGPLANLQPALSPAAQATATAAAAAAPLVDGAAGLEKKERKKRQHDPNAPKRPLTPFFLYMQTARPIIAKDLGSEVAKGAVSAEGTSRWKEMSEHDRTLWANAYKENLRLYNARMHSYKTGGNANAKDMTDDQAREYADIHNVGADTTAEGQIVAEANAGAQADADADAEGEPEKEPTPPPKTPKSKASRGKPKATKGTPAEIAPAPPAAPIVPTKSSTEKEKEKEKKETPATSNKRKRAAPKKADEPAGEVEEAVETPKSAPKPRKKKSKSDA